MINANNIVLLKLKHTIIISKLKEITCISCAVVTAHKPTTIAWQNNCMLVYSCIKLSKSYYLVAVLH